MKYLYLFLAFLSICHHAGGQAPNVEAVRDSIGYELYLAQVSLCEALIEIGEINEAKRTLGKTDRLYRGWEYVYLEATLDRSRHTLPQHNGPVSDVLFSPDGKLLATAGSDSTILLWNYPGLDRAGQFSGHTDGVSTLDFSPDGKFIASGSRDHTVVVWEVQSRKAVTRLTDGLSRGIYDVKFSPDGSMLGVTSWEYIPGKGVNGIAKVFDLPGGSLKRHFDLDPHPISAIDFSPDCKKVLIGSWGQVISYHDLATGQTEWSHDMSESIPEEYNAITSAELSPDGQWAVTCGRDNRTRLYEAATGKIIYQIEPHEGHRKWIRTVSFNGDGSLLATGAEDALLQVREAISGKLLYNLRGHSDFIQAVSWHPKIPVVATASLDGTVRVWDIDNAGVMSFDACHNGPWYSPVSPDGKYTATACSDTVIGIWNLTTGRREKILSGKSANCADFSPNGRQLVTAGHDDLITLWDIERQVEVMTMEGHTGSIYGIVWSGDHIASAGDTTVRIWNAGTGAEERVLEFPNSHPFALTFSPDHTMLFVGTTNGEVHLFNTNDWQPERQFKLGKTVNYLVINQDGDKLIAVGNTVHLLDLVSGKATELEGHVNSVRGAAFHPDGQYAVSCSYDQTVRFWDTVEGRCTMTLHALKDELYTISLLKDGSGLLVGATNGVMHVIRF